jgi:hypothetical protein
MNVQSVALLSSVMARALLTPGVASSSVQEAATSQPPGGLDCGGVRRYSC